MRALPPPRAWLVIAIFLALAVSAFAEFSVTYTGPVCTVTAPNGQQTQVPATVTPDGWISVGAQSYYPGTKFEINGTIRATLTWTGTGTGPDPQQMILQEDSEATYTSTLGAASNGLGDPCIVSSGGGSSQGSAWNVFTNDGVYTIRRRVSVRGEITASSGFGGVWLRYRVTPTPILPVVQGAVWHGSKFKCLPGHKLRLSVSTGSYSQLSHNWSLPDPSITCQDIIMDSGGSPEYRREEPLHNLVVPTLALVVKKAFDTPMTVESTCQITVHTPEGFLSTSTIVEFSVQPVTFSHRSPTYSGFTIVPGVDASTGNATTTFWAYEQGPQGTKPGVLIEVSSLDDGETATQLFGARGKWAYVQLVKYSVDVNGITVQLSADYRLDNSFPYGIETPGLQVPPGAEEAVSTSNRYMEDSPALGVFETPLATSVDIDTTGYCAALYIPPANGVGCRYVPVKGLFWNYDGQFVRNQQGQWILKPGAPTKVIELLGFSEIVIPFTWNAVARNISRFRPQ